MSELINNREYRQKKLKDIIGKLHQGKSVDEVKEEFEMLTEGISSSEIAQMEQALVEEGLPVEEIQRLCDVHAAVFKGAIEDIHKPLELKDINGHPVQTFYLENRAIEKLIEEKINKSLEAFKKDNSKDNVLQLLDNIHSLWEIDKHYSKKENLIFPFLEKYGIVTPPKVMWGVDDEIRAEIKEAQRQLEEYDQNLADEKKKELIEKIDHMILRIKEMIYKEENILMPMVTDSLSEDEWKIIDKDSEEIGYCLVKPKSKWQVVRKEINKASKVSQEILKNDAISLDIGSLTIKELNAMLNTLPLDITFVNKNGLVSYFSQSKERIFARTKSVIGREVTNCHPPASVHIVEEIVEDLKAGKKEHEDFWIKMGDKFVYIRYFAVRDKDGEFLGILEVTQNVKEIRELQGEKRLMS